jgi:hypothetical protein
MTLRAKKKREGVVIDELRFTLFPSCVFCAYAPLLYASDDLEQRESTKIPNKVIFGTFFDRNPIVSLNWPPCFVTLCSHCVGFWE